MHLLRLSRLRWSLFMLKVILTHELKLRNIKEMQFNPKHILDYDSAF